MWCRNAVESIYVSEQVCVCVSYLRSHLYIYTIYTCIHVEAFLTRRIASAVGSSALWMICRMSCTDSGCINLIIKMGPSGGVSKSSSHEEMHTSYDKYDYDFDYGHTIHNIYIILGIHISH